MVSHLVKDCQPCAVDFLKTHLHGHSCRPCRQAKWRCVFCCLKRQLRTISCRLF
ncbi:hypothetical protein BX666DRAFT_1978597 [Dichotomocladium elegans]|nr:hypothetical protein BX666DRAFT_1978597 [Dichotomocladium elegans]